MKGLLLILINSIFINNFVLAKFLGLCPVFGVSNQYKSAVGMSMATIVVLTITCLISSIVYNYILLPLDMAWLEIIVFIFLIAAVVQAGEIIIKAKSPILQRKLGIYLPLITTNCSVLGVALLSTRENYTVVESVFYGLGAGIGFGLVLVAFSAIREQQQTAIIPKVFQGSSIAMITMAIMSLSFMGFMGFKI